jgi:hypothetical protein
MLEVAVSSPINTYFKISGSSNNPCEISEKLSVPLTFWQTKRWATKTWTAAVKETESQRIVCLKHKHYPVIYIHLVTHHCYQLLHANTNFIVYLIIRALLYDFCSWKLLFHSIRELFSVGPCLNKKFCKELISWFLYIDHIDCVYIRCCGNFAKAFPSNGWIHM